MSILSGICNLLNGAPYDGFSSTSKCGCCPNEGRLMGIGSNSDLPWYRCYECWPDKQHKRGKTITEQLNDQRR